MHDLMTVRNMRHAVKHGHPSRIVRGLKYWLPMFYAGGSANYANEMMELLHNIHHDWPKDTARVQVAAMLVNNSGEEDSFTEADMDVEHLNLRVKDRTDGPNASPQRLERETPALGPCKDLTARVFETVGVESLNAHHSHVKQHKDVEILSKYLDGEHIFRWSEDKASEHAVIDLHRQGLNRLAGSDGGHAKHLARHILRFRARHDPDTYTALQQQENSGDLMRGWDQEPILYDIRDEEDIEEVEEVERGTYIP